MPTELKAALATTAEAADFLGCSRNLIFTLLKKGRLTRISLGNRSTRISWAELHALADAGQSKAPIDE